MYQVFLKLCEAIAKLCNIVDLIQALLATNTTELIEYCDTVDGSLVVTGYACVTIDKSVSPAVPSMVYLDAAMNVIAEAPPGAPCPNQASLLQEILDKLCEIKDGTDEDGNPWLCPGEFVVLDHGGTNATFQGDAKANGLAPGDTLDIETTAGATSSATVASCTPNGTNTAVVFQAAVATSGPAIAKKRVASTAKEATKEG